MFIIFMNAQNFSLSDKGVVESVECLMHKRENILESPEPKGKSERGGMCF